LPYEAEERLVEPNHPGAIRLLGAVTDGEGNAVDDALVEIWQANAAGRYAHPEDDRTEVPLEDGFTGFGRCATDSEGRFEFLTVKPGAVPGPNDHRQAPHIDVSVFARGLLNRLVTRIYFPDEEEANADDPVLSLIEDPAERETLIARAEDGALRFDIRLQGDGETTFFVI
jgi:protocatechuate 3,4-dioxygenase alpha subunit